MFNLPLQKSFEKINPIKMKIMISNEIGSIQNHIIDVKNFKYKKISLRKYKEIKKNRI